MLKSYLNGKSWEDKILDYYNKKGYFTYKIPTMNSGTVFDILAIHNGACLCIECKHITGDKLYYEGSGLKKKTNEIEHFINTTGNNLYLYVNSDKDGIFWTTWRESGELLKQQGYLKTSDMVKAYIEEE